MIVTGAEVLEEKNQCARAMLAAFGLDPKGKLKKGTNLLYKYFFLMTSYAGLGRELIRALKFMVNDDQIALYESIIQRALDRQNRVILGEEEENHDPTFFLNDGLDINEWTEGTEEFHHLTTNELIKVLGIPNNHIPGFNMFECVEGIHDPWVDHAFFLEAAQQWNDQQKTIASGGVIPLDLKQRWRTLEPRWHQFLGMYKMMLNFFDGKPTLLMDEVGLGKTMQVVGVIALLDYYRSYFAVHDKFPGQFGASHSQ